VAWGEWRELGCYHNMVIPTQRSLHVWGENAKECDNRKPAEGGWSWGMLAV
jgi:hypothetical protein